MKLDMLKGQLELVALASLREGPKHGYAIIKELRERSGGEFDLLEGTLYPALHRLEHAGLITSRWSTKRGAREFAEQESEWHRFARTLNSVLAGMT